MFRRKLMEGRCEREREVVVVCEGVLYGGRIS